MSITQFINHTQQFKSNNIIMKQKNTTSVNTHGIFYFDNPYWEKNVEMINNKLSEHISQITTKFIKEVLEYSIDTYFRHGGSCLVLTSNELNIGWWNGNTTKRNFLVEKELKKFLLKKNRFKGKIDFNKVTRRLLSDIFFYLHNHLKLMNIDMTKDLLNNQLISKQLHLDNIILNIPKSFILDTFAKHTIDSVDYYSGVIGLMKTYIRNNTKKFLKIMNDDIDQLEN